MKGQDVENVGIMSGFGDDLDSLIKEVMSEEGMTEGEEYETGKMMDRTPSSPEILMNNLRGDMRSIDARREELADMVGYGAAMETPEEVLALLQSQIAAEQAAGIGGLPAAGMAAMPGEMPPPPMPQGAPPMAQAPMNMAKGGYVQNFAVGSDEDGVTPADDSSSFGSNAFSPAMVDLAKQQVMLNLGQKPAEIPDLQSAMEKRLPIYEELLGGDSDMTEAQALLALSQAAFGYAANRDPQGRALTGSQFSRLAGAFQNVPGQLAKLGGEKAKQERAIKAAALAAGEKDVENIRASNAKLLDSQRRIWTSIAKSSGTSGWFGKGSGEYNIINQPNFVERYALGQTTNAEDNLFETAYSRLQAKAKPTKSRYTDDRGYLVETDVPGVPIPKFVTDAVKMRGEINTGAEITPIVPETEDEAIAKIETTTGTPVKPETEDQGPKLGQLTATQTKVAFPEWNKNDSDPFKVDPKTHNYFRPQEKTIYNMIVGDKGVTGPVDVTLAGLSRLPLVGPVIGDVDRAEARTFVDRAVESQIVTALRTNPKFVDKERQEIKQEVGLTPGIIDNAEAYIGRLRGVHGLLLETQGNALRTINSSTANKKDIDDAKKVIEDVHNAMRVIGLPIEITDPNDPVLPNLAPGTPFIYNGQWRTARGAQ
jgi:hypothetical protein